MISKNKKKNAELKLIRTSVKNCDMVKSMTMFTGDLGRALGMPEKHSSYHVPYYC